MADDEVVEQGDVEQPAGGERLRGQVQVVGRRRRVAARVVVDEDDARRVEPDRVAEQLADPDQRRADVALVDRRDAQDVVLRVEEDDAQLLALEAAHLEDEPVGDVARAADRPAAGRPVGEQPPTELERRHELGGLRRADARDAGQLELARAGEAGQPVVRASASAARSTADRPRVAAAPQQGDELGGASARRRRAGRAARAVARRRAARGSRGRREPRRRA